MFSKSVVVSVVALCSFALLPFLNGQQFRSAHLMTVSPTPAGHPFGEVYGIADFNGDGRPDLLISTIDPTGTTVVLSTMLQNSNGTFTERLTSILAGFTVVADLNGDGKPDFAMVQPGPSNDHGDPLGPATLTIGFGNGDGTFRAQAPVDLAGDELRPWVLVEDLNRDGKPDIITTAGDQYGDATIQTFLNNGNGTFRAGTTYTGVIGGDLLAAGDFTGDGFGDVVIKNNFQTQILLGKGDGSFMPGATYNLNAYAVGVGDMNRDHHLDLAIVTVKNTEVMLGKGDGTFTTSATLDTTYATAIDTTEFGNPVTPTQVYVDDLNKDGISDLAVVSLSATCAVSVYYGKGNGTFTNPKPFNVSGSSGSGSTPVAFGDLNRDGYIDAVIATWGHFAIANGTSDGGFNAPVITQARYAGSIAKGDFNGDGIEDIAVVAEPICSSCTGTSVRVFLGTGKGFFGSPKTYSIPVKWGAIAAGDVNRDGKIDLVVTRNAFMMNNVSGRPYTTPDLAVLLGRGDGTFEAPASYTLLGAPVAGTWSDTAYLVDVNHDGKLDLVGDWGTALGNGKGQFGKPIPLPSNLGAIMAIAPGDFRASGTVDLAIATATYDASLQGWTLPAFVYTLSGNGNGSFTINHQQSISGFPYNLVSADLNGDGLDDILYTFTTSQGSTTYINLGVNVSQAQGGFSTATYSYPSSGFPASTDIVTGDFNRDGKMDVVFFGLLSNGADVTVLFGAGGGLLNKTPQYYQGEMGKGLVLDVNGDGAPDIAGTTTIGVSRLLNTGHK